MKFDFGDLYKFIVSAGLALAGGVIIALWLLLKEPFDLTLKEADIKALSPLAQQTVRERQQVVATLVAWAPMSAPVLIGAGLGIAWIGLVRWKRLQSGLDEIADISLREKRASIRPQTEDENAEKSSGSEIDVALAPVSRPKTSQGLLFEQNFISRVVQHLPSDYSAQTNMMVADVGVDILLKGSGLLAKDYLLEVKHIQRGFNEGWLLQVALKMRSAALAYQQVAGRNPNTCLVVAVSDDAWARRNYDAIVRNVENDLPKRAGKHRIVVERVSKLQAMTPYELGERLGIDLKDGTV